MNNSEIQNPKSKISILMPVYNTAATLPACLRSIQRKTETNWECIIVDDGSTDDTVRCAQAFADDDARFMVIACPHRGIVETLNAGLDHCSGTYIARMDGDDLMHRDRLAAQLNALERHPELSAVGCQVRIFPRSSLKAGRLAYERWLNGMHSAQQVRLDRFVECPIAHPTLMIRSEVMKQFRYQDRGWPEDYDLILRLLTAGHELSVVPRRLLSWRNDPQRLSRTDARYDIRKFVACKAYFIAQDFLADSDQYVLQGFGGTGRTLCKALRALDKFPSLIVDLDPRRIGHIIHGAKVIHADDFGYQHGQKIIASVAGADNRQYLRDRLSGFGYHEVEEFICAA